MGERNRSKGAGCWKTGLILLGSLGLMIVMYSLAAIRRGTPPGLALAQTAASERFWVELVVPLGVLLVLIGLLPRWFRRGTGGAWNRRRWLFTGINLAALVGLGISIYLFRRIPLTPGYWDLFLLLASWFVPILLVTAWVWLQRPDPEYVEATETGDYARLLDERERLIRRKTAEATLKFSFILILFGGGLFDVLVTHLAPVRSMIELELIGGAWLYYYYRFKAEV